MRTARRVRSRSGRRKARRRSSQIAADRRASRRRRRRDRRRRHDRARSSLAARQAGYELGYRDGVNDGAEILLDGCLPHDVLIPDLTPQEAVAAGVQSLRVRGLALLQPPDVYAELEEAIANRRPYAFIRLGDGELLTLAQRTVLTDSEIRRHGSFLSYSGIAIPDLAARDELALAVKSATLVGVPLSRKPFFQPLLFRVLKAHGIDIGALRLTTSTMNYSLYQQGYLTRLIQGRRILVMGNVADRLAEALAAQGFDVAGAICPVRGFADAARAADEAAAVPFDIALVAAGIAAVPICVRLAGNAGRTAIDFGHLANHMAGVPRIHV